MIRKLAVFGVGLIGGSFALALRRAGVVGQVVGYGRNRGNLETARSLGVLDAIAETPGAAVLDADAICLATPVGALPALLAEIAPYLGNDALITDVGSTKQDVIRAARVALGDCSGQFVPGHPIAGAEDSGAAAARSELFHGKSVILTPLAENRAEAVARVSGWWQDCGATVATMEAERHDRIFAAVSHLPHLAAFALVAELAGRPEAALFFQHAGSGFRDFTRIAASHPEMWRDIALANQGALLDEIDHYQEALARLRQLLESGDSVALHDLFERASMARRTLTTYLDRS